MAKSKAAWFDDSVELPPGFGGTAAIRRAIEYMEKELADLVEIYHEQANVFSAIVGIFGVKALDAVSNWEKHKHVYTAQQRFPTFVDAAAKCRLQHSIVWKVRRVSVLGPFNPTTIIQVGTSFGVISSIRPNPLRGVGQ